MTKHQVVVTQKRVERLPDWAAQFVMVISSMRQAGKLDEIARQLRVPRQGGYSDVDMVVVLMCFLCSSIESIKEFGRRSTPYREQVAALADRKDLPSPSSISRYLNSAKLEDVEAFVDPWLLSLADGDLVNHEQAAWRDRCGKRWWFFDWDPTMITLRKRGLPTIESLPEAKRRAEKAKPGYPGRKRGEVQFCRSIIGQTASAQPLGMRLQPGNGELHKLIAHAVDTVRKAVSRADLPPRRSVVRADGVGGCVAFITECKQAGLRYLARLSRYHWLESVEVAQHLDDTLWEVVEDSGSGPRREATDLGWVKIHAGKQSKRADGTHFDPVRARVVVSRFKPSEQSRSTGSGKLIDGWVYEMYVTDLDAASWSKADVVRLYYARSGCENRYAQMIREQHINRLFCYEPAGQLLVTALALWLFGRQAQWGEKLDGQPVLEEPQKPHVSHDDISPQVHVRVEDPPILQQSKAESSPKVDDVAQVLSPQEVAKVLERFDPSWRWSSSIQGFICPRGQAVTLRKKRGNSVIFSPTKTACRGCPFRQEAGNKFVCSRSTHPEFRKEIWVEIGAERSAELDLDKLREIRPRPRYDVDFESIEEPSRHLNVACPSLFPAHWRKLFRQASEDVEVEVKVEPSSQPLPPIRTTAEMRQRRRLSWEQRHLKGALRQATVRLTMRGSAALEQYLSSLKSTDDDRYVVEIAS